MKKINDGGPAYPVNYISMDSCGNERVQAQDFGMSLRDYCAAKAPIPPKWWIDCYGKNLNDLQSEAELIAKWNYAYADAMLKAREE